MMTVVGWSELLENGTISVNLKLLGMNERELETGESIVRVCRLTRGEAIDIRERRLRWRAALDCGMMVVDKQCTKVKGS